MTLTGVGTQAVIITVTIAKLSVLFIPFFLIRSTTISFYLLLCTRTLALYYV